MIAVNEKQIPSLRGGMEMQKSGGMEMQNCSGMEMQKSGASSVFIPIHRKKRDGWGTRHSASLRNGNADSLRE